MRLRSRAFTLVELMVVIGVVALLAVLLFTGVSRARLTAGQVTDASNLRQITAAALTYANDNNGTIISPNTALDTGALWVAAARPYYFYGWYTYQIQAYIPDPSVFRSNPILQIAGGTNVLASGAYFYCYNLNLNAKNGTFVNKIYRGGNIVIGYQANPLQAITSPSRNPFCADMAPVVNGQKLYPFFGGVNVSYLDGHVQWIQGDGTGDPYDSEEFALAWQSK